MENFLSKFCSLSLTMLVFLLMIHVTVAADNTKVAANATEVAATATEVAANATKETATATEVAANATKETANANEVAANATKETAKDTKEIANSTKETANAIKEAANDTKEAAKDTTVASKKECQASLNKNISSLVDVTVADTERLNTREFKIVIKDGETFSSIFTGNCTVDNIPDMSVEYRMQGSTDWSQVALEEIEGKQKGNSKNLIELGKVRLDEELNYCQEYQIKLKVNNDDTKSDIIEFGTLKNDFTPEELKVLDEDVRSSDKIVMSFEELKDEFNATWSNICSESVKIWLKNGTDTKFTPLTESNANNSILIPMKPCTEYHLELESFLAPDPGTKKHGTSYVGSKQYFTSSPQNETFGHIKMEENSTKLSWDFTEYFKHKCVVKETLSYNITFGGKHILKEAKNPKATDTLDIEKAIKDKKLNHLENFCPYEVKMEIVYETKTNKKMVTTFSKYLITNSGGDFSEATKPTLEQDDFNLKVVDISHKSTCLEKTYKFDCWLADKNQSFSAPTTAHTDTIKILALNLTAETELRAGNELKCKVKIEYTTPGENQPNIETEWSEALKLTVKEEATSSVGTIVGVVIFVVLLAGCVGAAVVYYRRRRSSVGLSSSTHGLSYGSQ